VVGRNGDFGAEPPVGIQGAEPRWEVRGRSPPEADDILLIRHWIFALMSNFVCNSTNRKQQVYYAFYAEYVELGSRHWTAQLSVKHCTSRLKQAVQCLETSSSRLRALLNSNDRQWDVSAVSTYLISSQRKPVRRCSCCQMLLPLLCPN